MRVFLLPVLAATVALSGCQMVYRLPTRQGNVIEQRDLEKLKPGMTREQVKFVMGTPLAATPFRADRWDYVGYYKSPRGEIAQRTVTLTFEGDLLAKLEGIDPPGDKNGQEAQDAISIIQTDKQDREAAVRAAEENESNPTINRDERRP